MPPTVDPIARAYAIIGLPRGSSTRELKKQYKRLVRQWHPDRWHNDPVAQAEAAIRMRAINDAYATLEELAPGPPLRSRTAAPPAAPSATPSAAPAATAYRPLTKEEMDAIVNAIGTENPFRGTMRVVIGVASIAVAYLMIQPYRGAELMFVLPGAGTLTMAGIIFAFGIAVLVYHTIRS